MILGFAFTAHSFDDMFVVACLENGEVYSWGYVPKSSTIRIFKNPSLIESLPKTVTEVACGSGHVLALTSDGEVETAIFLSFILQVNPMNFCLFKISFFLGIWLGS